MILLYLSLSPDILVACNTTTPSTHALALQGGQSARPPTQHQPIPKNQSWICTNMPSSWQWRA